MPVDPPAADVGPAARGGQAGAGAVRGGALPRGARGRRRRGPVVWQRPRFEAPGKPPLLLRDYAEFGPAFEVDYPTAFADTREVPRRGGRGSPTTRRLTADDLAKKHGLDAAFLKRWVEVLAVEPPREGGRGRPTPCRRSPLTLLDEKTPPNAGAAGDQRLAEEGDRPAGPGGQLVRQGRADPRPGVRRTASAVHPMPKEFVAVVWKSPVAGQRDASTAQVAHAHPACGNGVAWWLEHRRGGRATVLGEGAVDLGKEAKPPAKTLKVEKGDVLVLAVDARDGNHVCDMTEIAFTRHRGRQARPRRGTWPADVADNVQAGNPHADKHGNEDTWSFVRGPSQAAGQAAAARHPGRLGPRPVARGRGRPDATGRGGEAGRSRSQALLSGPRPANEKSPGPRPVRQPRRRWTARCSPAWTWRSSRKPRPKRGTFGLPKERFGSRTSSLVAPADAVIEVRLPAALFVGREFVVDAKLDGAGGRPGRPVRGATTPPAPDARWDGPVLAAATGAGVQAARSPGTTTSAACSRCSSASRRSSRPTRW